MIKHTCKGTGQENPEAAGKTKESTLCLPEGRITTVVFSLLLSRKSSAYLMLLACPGSPTRNCDLTRGRGCLKSLY